MDFFFVVVGSVTAVVTTRRSDIVRPTASTSSIQRANDDVQVTFDCRSPAWLGVGLGFFFYWISLGFHQFSTLGRLDRVPVVLERVLLEAFAVDFSSEKPVLMDVLRSKKREKKRQRRVKSIVCCDSRRCEPEISVDTGNGVCVQRVLTSA